MERNPDQALTWRILTSGVWLKPKEGQFLGGLSFDANPLTDKQANWLAILADRYGIEGGAA